MLLVKLTALTELLDAQAAFTWHTTVDARELEADFGEVTATQLNLMSIQRMARSTRIPLRVQRITQNVEKRFGADWEFWILLRSGLTLGYSIQAKKAYLDETGSYGYRELGHRGERAGERQYDTLIRHSQKYGSIPIHVFYNGWLPSNRIPFTPPAPPEQYGCAAVSTYVVRDTRAASKGKGMNRVSHYASASFPWSDLFRLSPPAPVGASGPDHARPSHSTPAKGDAISTTQADLIGLAGRMSELASYRAQFSPSLALPDYILQSRDLPVDALPADSLLPQFAVVLAADK